MANKDKHMKSLDYVVYFLIKRNYFNIIRYVIFNISIINYRYIFYLLYTSIVVVALLSLST